jgi:hypothetical protein
MYRVPRAELGGLVGMLAMRPAAGSREVWTDAVREPRKATPHLIRRHTRKVLRAFGWFAHTTDLGWLRLPMRSVH